jgi:hypothetical protein
MTAQSLIARQDFSDTNAHANISLPAGREITGRYEADFGFHTHIQHSTSDEPAAGFLQPLYRIDDAACRLIEMLPGGVPLLERLVRAFSVLCAYAEHDDIHAMTLPWNRGHANRDNWSFAVQQIGDMVHGNDFERHALTLHTIRIKTLFASEPRHATAFRVAANSFFDTLVHIHAGASRFVDRADARDLASYFADFAAHRIFRVVSPNDPELRASHTAASIAKLALPAMAAPNSHMDQANLDNGIDILWERVAAARQDGGSQYGRHRVYKPLHDPLQDRFDLVSCGQRHLGVSAIKAMQILQDNIPEKSMLSDPRAWHPPSKLAPTVKP